MVCSCTTRLVGPDTISCTTGPIVGLSVLLILYSSLLGVIASQNKGKQLAGWLVEMTVGLLV